MNERRKPRPYLTLLTLLSALTALAGATAFAQLLWLDGGDIMDVLLVILFALLFLWINVGFWTATFGFVWTLFHPRRPAPVTPPETDEEDGEIHLPKTAIVMPIYNEGTARVFAGLEAMYESLQQTGDADVFDFFVLSDTTDPDVWLEEEEAFARMRASIDAVSYTHLTLPTN